MIVKDGNRTIETSRERTKYIIVFAAMVLLLTFISSAALAAEKNVTISINVYTKKDIGVAMVPVIKAATPGTKVSYAVTISNPNPVKISAIVGASVPPGWTAELDNNNITINPQSSRSFTLRVTSDTISAPGSYLIEISAETDAGIKGKARASYSVDTHAAADVSLDPETQAGIPGRILRYTVH